MSKIGQINYDIQFEPIFTNFTFNGIEIITLTTTSTNTFTLNSAELEIKNCHIIHKGKTIKAKSSLNAKNETLSIKTTKKISRFKTYTIIIKCVFCVLSDQAICFWMRRKIKRIKMKC